MPKNSAPTVVDLFSGCGGLSYGLIQAGFDVILGVDNDKDSLITFEANHPGSKAVNIDLADPESSRLIKEAVGGRSIDVIVGGPPCQGFSLTGSRNMEDPRNKLYLSMFNIVRDIKPKAFIIENVSGMATLYGGKVKEDIINKFEGIGYNVKAKLLCAADYGVPQMRKRLVFVGVLEKYGEFDFPIPTFTQDNYVTSGEAISDLPSNEIDLGSEEADYTTQPQTKYQRIMRGNSRKLYNHVATCHTEKVVKVISQVPEGGNHKDLPNGVGEHRKFNEAWTRYHSQKPSRTIDTGHRNHFHYKYNRIPTVRENARLQSFPDTFKFYGSRTSQNRQVGNAVPPLLSYNLGNNLIRIIKKESCKKDLATSTIQ